MKRIVITGPESTGKSKLSEQLAIQFSTLFVPELARDYLKRLKRNYTFNDVEKIARLQLKEEQSYIKKVNNLLFADTGPEVIYIWMQVKFGKCPGWIADEIKTHPYDLYLLCYPDLPWEADPLREAPDYATRIELFNRYEKLFSELNLNYQVITGINEKRLNLARTIVEKHL